VRFEWDSEKAAENLRKHGVSFDEAATAFFDPLSVTIPDPDHSAGEQRFITMGASSTGKLLVAAHTESGSTLRIISARPPSATERKRHEN
jgi:uncharacterized protein